jgi:hypothetical protein
MFFQNEKLFAVQWLVSTVHMSEVETLNPQKIASTMLSCDFSHSLQANDQTVGTA